MNKTYSGIHIPLISPMKNGEIDYVDLSALIDKFVGLDIASIIPCGSTGESSTLLHEEHNRVTEYVLDYVAGRVPVMAGTGSNSTHETIQLTQYAQQAGAHSALIVTPYYNRPTQDGMIRHFKTIAEQCDIDIILYNIPSRTGVDMSVETIIKLSEVPGIKGIKEGSGNLVKMTALCHHFMDQDFSILTGEDSLLLPCCALGGDGGVMASASVFPVEIIDIYKYSKMNDIVKANDVYKKVGPLIELLFKETNPIVIKYVLSKMHGLSSEIRSPLFDISEETRKTVDQAFLGYF